MQPEEVEMLADHVHLLTVYERNFNSRELGERVRLTTAERERLSLWPIKPHDMSDEQLGEQRKAKSRHRRAIKRREKGIRTKEAYLLSWRAGPSLGLMRVLANEPGRGAKRRSVAMRVRSCRRIVTRQ